MTKPEMVYWIDPETDEPVDLGAELVSWAEAGVEALEKYLEKQRDFELFLEANVKQTEG